MISRLKMVKYNMTNDDVSLSTVNIALKKNLNITLT